MDDAGSSTATGRRCAGRGDDLRTSVTSWDESIPLPLRFHVVHLYDAETGAGEYFHFGLELGEEPPGKDAAIAMPELTALTLRRSWSATRGGSS